jgi:hypothetical protein
MTMMLQQEKTQQHSLPGSAPCTLILLDTAYTLSRGDAWTHPGGRATVLVWWNRATDATRESSPRAERGDSGKLFDLWREPVRPRGNKYTTFHSTLHNILLHAMQTTSCRKVSKQCKVCARWSNRIYMQRIGIGTRQVVRTYNCNNDKEKTVSEWTCWQWSGGEQRQGGGRPKVVQVQ